MPDGGWDSLPTEEPSRNTEDPSMNHTNGDDFADQYNLMDDDDDVREYGDDDLNYDLEAVTNANDEDGDTGNEGERSSEKEEGVSDRAEEKKEDGENEEEEGEKIDIKDEEENVKEGEKDKDDEDGEQKDDTIVEAGESKEDEGENTSELPNAADDGNTVTPQTGPVATSPAGQQQQQQQQQLCPKHREPFVKNRYCKSCRTVETRVKKMEKIVGNKVQLCDSYFQDINQLQTAIHTGMDKVKEDIQERSRQLIAEIQKLEQQELALLQQHREQRIEKLRGIGQTLMETAKAIRDEHGVVQDKVEGTPDAEFNESMKELRKACQKKMPQPDARLKLIGFVAGKEDKLGEVFGKIDEKPKEEKHF